MNHNVVVCRNEVLIEGVNVGQFETFGFSTDCRTLGATGMLTLPLYAIGTQGTQGAARSRVRKKVVLSGADGNQILARPCSQIEVNCWYDSWNVAGGKFDSMPKRTMYRGFIEHVEEGFPARLHVQDNSFILRFGTVEKGWDGSATCQSIIADCIKIAEDAFKKERDDLGFTRVVSALTYGVKDQNVSAVTTELSLRNWGASSPFETVQKLMQMLCLYGGVTKDFNVYVGIGVEDSTRAIVELDTRSNVINRRITPVDGRFVDYDVKVTGMLENGKRFVATAGYGNSRSRANRSEFEKTYGEPVRVHSVLRTESGIQTFADNLLASLKGTKNKGTITCLLYPELNIMDYVNYTDSVFPELSSGLYVIEYDFSADGKGYYQTLSVSDKIFAL